MALCRKCGTDIPDDSRSCKRCGTSVADGQAENEQPQAWRPWGADRFGHGSLKDLSKRWDEALGIASPVMMGFIGVACFLFVWFIVETVEVRTGTPEFWDALGDFLVFDSLLFVGLIFLGTFHGYFYRRYHATYRWIGPLITATFVAGWAWVLAQMLILGGLHSEYPELRDAGGLLDDLIAVVFVLTVLTAYAILWFSLVSPADSDPPKKRE